MELCEGGVAVRFPSAMSRKIGIGHHAIKRVNVDMVYSCVFPRRITGWNPSDIAITYKNCICLCCYLVEAIPEPDASWMRRWKAHITAARVKDTKPGNLVSQLNQLRRVRMVSTRVSCDY